MPDQEELKVRGTFSTRHAATAAAERRGIARLLPVANLAGSLYGMVLVTSVLVTLRGSEKVGYMVAAVVVTAAVFAFAHAWAHALAGSHAAGAPLDRYALRRSLGHEWSMVQATGPAVAVLLLAAFEVYSPKTALWIAVLLNVALLFTWGAGLRQHGGGTPVQVLAAGAASASLGLVLVALKVLVH